jgi:ubiquinone/menaquinone biosynthesis C-methylase UbiE
MNGRIRAYWDKRAEEAADSPKATTEDIWLRELEIGAIADTLAGLEMAGSGRLIDIGCGDGYSTVRIAERLPGLAVLGVDFSGGMIENARRRLESKPELRDRMSFIRGDVSDLGSVCGDTYFDFALTDRCLINLDSYERQSDAISRIARSVKPGGYYVSVENFDEGHKNMNVARNALKLSEIPIRWHNLYFSESGFISAAEKHFEEIRFKDFSSSYYFATRVIYSAMCLMRGEEIDYNHEIHQLAVRLPWVGQFSPVRMAVLRKGRLAGEGS